MGIHPQWTDEPEMTATATVDRAAHMARQLESWTAAQRGVSVSQARVIVAREAAVPPGTLENLRRSPPRLKSIPAWIKERLAALLIRKIEAEIVRLNHELEIACRVASRPDEASISEAKAAIEAAKTAIKNIR